MGSAYLFGGEKGGTGKSTLSINMAIMAAEMGHDVLFLDADRQATASKFFERRLEKELQPPIYCDQLQGSQVHKIISNHCRSHEIVIIDAGGQNSPELQCAMKCPDVKKFYAPLRPAVFDLSTLTTLYDLTDIAKIYNEQLSANVILNMCSTHAKASAPEYAADLIKQEFSENLTLCPVRIHERIAYQYSCHESQAVYEWENAQISAMPPYRAKQYRPKATVEMIDLFKDVFTFFFNDDFYMDTFLEKFSVLENMGDNNNE